MSIDTSTPTTEVPYDGTPEDPFPYPLWEGKPCPGQFELGYGTGVCVDVDPCVLADGTPTTDYVREGEYPADGSTMIGVADCWLPGAATTTVAVAAPPVPPTTQATHTVTVVAPQPVTELPATGLGLDIAIVAGAVTMLGIIARFGSRRKEG